MEKFTTTEGAVLTLVRVAPIKLQLVSAEASREARAAGAPLDPPTYTATDETTGIETTFEHDDASILDDRTPETDREAYRAYLAAKDKLQATINARLTSMLLARGVQDDPPADGWDARQREDGLAIPESARDRKIHWLQTEMLVDPQDAAALFMALITLSGKGVVSEEAIAAARDSFRSAVAAAGRPEVARPAPEAAQESLVPLPPPAGSGDGASVGPDAQPVRRAKSRRPGGDAGPGR